MLKLKTQVGEFYPILRAVCVSFVLLQAAVYLGKVKTLMQPFGVLIVRANRLCRLEADGHTLCYD